MKTSRFHPFWGVAIGLAMFGMSPRTQAEESNPYLPIAEINPFRLKDPPVPITTETAPTDQAKPPAKIKLTGTTSIFKEPKALFEIIETTPGKNPSKPILSVGEKFEDLEVLAINVEKSEATIRYAGAVTNITFSPIETAKAAAPAANANAATGGKPTPTPGSHGAAAAAAAAAGAGGPIIVSRNNNAGSTRGGVGVFGPSPMDQGNQAQGQQAIAVKSGASYNASTTANELANRLRNVPTRPNQPNPIANQQAVPPMTPEQLKVWIEAQKALDPARASIYPNVSGGHPLLSPNPTGTPNENFQ